VTFSYNAILRNETSKFPYHTLETARAINRERCISRSKFIRLKLRHFHERWNTRYHSYNMPLCFRKDESEMRCVNRLVSEISSWRLIARRKCRFGDTGTRVFSSSTQPLILALSLSLCSGSSLLTGRPYESSKNRGNPGQELNHSPTRSSDRRSRERATARRIPSSGSAPLEPQHGNGKTFKAPPGTQSALARYLPAGIAQVISCLALHPHGASVPASDEKRGTRLAGFISLSFLAS